LVEVAHWWWQNRLKFNITTAWYNSSARKLMNYFQSCKLSL